MLEDWQQYQVSVKNQIQFYMRTYRFWLILTIILLIGGGISIALTIKGADWVHSNFGMTATDYIGGLVGFVTFLAIVTGAFFGGDAISTDFGTKTGYYMLSQPVRRSVLLAGRYTAAFLVSMLAFAVFYGFALYGGIAFYSFSEIPWANLALSFLFAALLILGILSFAFCLSASSKSPAIGLVVTIIVLLVVFNIVDSLVRAFLGANWLWYSIYYASGSVADIITGGSGTGIAGGTAGPPYWESIAIMLGYAVGFFLLAYVLYDREET